jgi:hypothetical protein
LKSFSGSAIPSLLPDTRLARQREVHCDHVGGRVGGPTVQTSSSWLRRAILPAFCALLLASVIELTIELRYHPSFWQRSTYLMYDPFHSEPFDRAELAIRLSHVEDGEPDIISVGDSSGFFSLQPTIVNRYLGGMKYVDLNTGANHAFDGYYAIAEYMLRRSHHVKYIVLYLFPTLLPQEPVFQVADLAPITYEDLVSPKAYLTPPSAAISPYGKFEVFEGRHFHKNDPLGNTVPLQQLTNTVEAAQGWLPEFDVRYDRIGGVGPFYSDERSTLLSRLHFGETSSTVAYLSKFDRMIQSYGSKMAIAFAPLPPRYLQPGDPNEIVADQALAGFQQQHPDVKFLFPLLTYWAPEKFGMFNHISREYTFLSSRRLGEGLVQLIDHADDIPPYKAHVTELRPPYPPISIKATGAPDPKLLDSALALFRYTTTADPTDWQLVSRRVQDELGREPAFGYMMADVEARAAALATQRIKIGLDTSQLQATPVEVSGVPFCDPRPDLLWVQVGGSIIFTFDSPSAHLREPVAWPQTSSILFPTILEDGVRKFDGYCPEPSMTAAQGR